jgi:hypothetical protein
MCASLEKHFRLKIPKTKPKENINRVEINNPNEDQQLEFFFFFSNLGCSGEILNII